MWQVQRCGGASACAVKDLKATEHLGWEGMGDVGPKTIAFLDGKC